MAIKIEQEKKTTEILQQQMSLLIYDIGDNLPFKILFFFSLILVFSSNFAFFFFKIFTKIGTYCVYFAKLEVKNDFDFGDPKPKFQTLNPFEPIC